MKFPSSAPIPTPRISRSSASTKPAAQRQSTGIQGRAFGNFGPAVEQLGLISEAPVDRTRLHWYAGMAIYNGRSAARAYGITDAAITA
jgi:hypothetical protein